MLALWTVVIFFSMDVFRPNDVQMVGVISRWFAAHGMPQYTPAKLFHIGVYFVWAVLFAGATGDGYLQVLSDRASYRCLLAVSIFSAVPEALQHFNPARTASFFDYTVNLFGSYLGLLCQFTYSRWRNDSVSVK